MFLASGLRPRAYHLADRPGGRGIVFRVGDHEISQIRWSGSGRLADLAQTLREVHGCRAEQGQVKATELQDLLNGLSPGDMVRLTRTQFATAFGTHGSSEEQKRAARDLAHLYGCDVRFTRAGRFCAVFTRRQT